MGSLSDTVETAIGKAIFQNTSYAAGATLYLALGTAASDTSFTEVANANNYSRTACTMSAGNWPEDGTIKGKFTNNFTVTTATASGSWGTPSVWSLWTSATYGAGTMVVWGSIDASAIASIGNTQFGQFQPGTLVSVTD